MSFLPSALPWREAAAFPALLVLVLVLLFSTATLAFYLKQRTSLHRLHRTFGTTSTLRGSVLAAALGAATPFCTCTALPLFVGMLEVEVPLGPATSFLLASPTINLGAVIVLLVVFGPRVALFYGGSCLLASIVVGWLMGRIPRNRALREFLWVDDESRGTASIPALRQATSLARQLTRRLLPWLLLATATGIAVDAILPTSVVAHLGTWSGVLAIPAAVAVGAVVYADILLLIPIGYALIQHGAPAPVVLTFMLAASGLSFAEMIVLGRVLQRWPALTLIGATVLIYTFVGYGLDFAPL